MNPSCSPSSVPLGPVEHYTLPASLGQFPGGTFSPSNAMGKGGGWSHGMSGAPMAQQFGKALALGAVQCTQEWAWATPGDVVAAEGVGSRNCSLPQPGACGYHSVQQTLAVREQCSNEPVRTSLPHTALLAADFGLREQCSPPASVPGERCGINGSYAGPSSHGASGVPLGVSRGSFFGAPAWGRQDGHQGWGGVPGGMALSQQIGDHRGLPGRLIESQRQEMDFCADGTLDDSRQRAIALTMYGQHALAGSRPGSSVGHHLQEVPAQNEGQFSPQTWAQPWHGATATQALSTWERREAVDYMHEQLEKARRNRQMWEAQEQQLRRAMAGLPLAPAGLGPITEDMQYVITGRTWNGVIPRGYI